MTEITLVDNAVIQGPIPRSQIIRLESKLRELEQIDPEKCTYHHFAEGIYLRELFMAAGSVVVGKIHRTQHLTIIASGTVRITTSNGVEEITGPAVFVSEAGAKKAIYAITDSTLMNPHPTDETDLVKLEEQFIAPSFEALESKL